MPQSTPPPSPHLAALPRQRPARVRVLDELGRSRTLDDSPKACTCLFASTADAPSSAQIILLLGLGLQPENLAALLEAQHTTGAADIFFVECPEFTAQLPSIRPLPPHWHALTPHEAQQHMRMWHTSAQPWAVWSYTPETRMFSRFWGPLLGYILAQRWEYPTLKNATADAEQSGEGQSAPIRRAIEQPSRTILIPGHARGLLSTELASGFAAHGFTPLLVPVEPVACLNTVLAHLRNERPALFFSVNLQGFDPEGLLFQALKTSGVPTGTWFVDNPWHILSQLRAPWWQELALFVSDASFMVELRRSARSDESNRSNGSNEFGEPGKSGKSGAHGVTHLPLAAWYSPDALPAYQTPPRYSDLPSPLVFVGRSAFPQRDSFFAGCRVPAPLLDVARAHLMAPPLPDVQWWGQQLGVTDWWPGSACRQAGLGAEQCSMERRALWLRTASSLGLTVYGDDAWQALLPSEVTVRPPVDYYSALPHIYAAAPYSLNVTSLLLPAGLTQRHFDVWMAGGLLLTDATPGLALFPKELTEPITLSSPGALPATLERFERDPLLRPHLQQSWQKLLRDRHTYVHRVGTILTATGLG